MQLRAVLGEVARAENVDLHPRSEGLAVARDGVPLAIEGIVTLVVVVRVAGGRATGYVRHGRDRPAREHDAARTRHEPVDDLLDGHDDLLRGERGFFLYAGETPELHVATTVGLLGVDDRH